MLFVYSNRNCIRITLQVMCEHNLLKAITLFLLEATLRWTLFVFFSRADVDEMICVEFHHVSLYLVYAKRWQDAKRLVSRRGISSLSFSIASSEMRCMQCL